MTKKELGDISGDFSTNASGHPARNHPCRPTSESISSETFRHKASRTFFFFIRDCNAISKLTEKLFPHSGFFSHTFYPPNLLMKFFFYLRGSVIPFIVGFCYRQVAIVLRLLGIIIIITRSLEPIPWV
jgi:hypothetical protein